MVGIHASTQLADRTGDRQIELPVRAGIHANSAESVRNTLVRSPFIGVIGGTLGCFIAYSQLQPFQPVDLEGISRLGQAGTKGRATT